jgi:hypothetical protein
MTNVVGMALQDILQSKSFQVSRSASAYNASSVQVTDLYIQSAFSGGIVNQQTKAEKNRENHERKKANKIAKRGTKSNEPFRSLVFGNAPVFGRHASTYVCDLDKARVEFADQMRSQRL